MAASHVAIVHIPQPNPLLPMYLLHGTWIPQKTDNFRQTGRFCVWAETVHTRSGRPIPTLLDAPALATLLAEELGLVRDAPALGRRLQSCQLLLPSHDGERLAAPALARRLDLPQPPMEAAVELQSYEVSCHVLGNVLSDLKQLDFLCRYRLGGVEIGNDLGFWCRFSRVVARLLVKEQYLPALRYQLQVSHQGRRSKTTSAEIYPGWEIASLDYEQSVMTARQQLPGLAANGFDHPPTDRRLHDSESLLRHFAEVSLHNAVTRTLLPTTFLNRFRGSLLDHCLRSEQDTTARSGAWWQQRYQQWQRWHHSLSHGRQGSGLQLCLQLMDPERDNDSWYLAFHATAPDDPSLRPSLADYWQDSDTRTLVQRHFGQDAERQWLLALGYAARMYPRLWDGLDSERPEGLTLSVDEAHDFLTEHAPVLQDAGFQILVPSWWTPQGRQRARLRLRVTANSATTTANASSGYFSMDSLLGYRYELAIGGQPVSVKEWQQLVDAKSPLVRFRGQWLALDGAEMQRMLAFWREHGQEDAEISLGELLHRQAAASDDVVVDETLDLAALLATLHDPARLEPTADPAGLQGNLRDYQQRGLAWLGFVERLGLGACLADDMGLGKTVQVLARLLAAGPEERPTLLIAPTSVLGNWQREAARFAPSIPVHIHHGGERLTQPKDFAARCQAYRLVVTSYGLARRDSKLLQGVAWQRVVIDEAHNIKNPAAAQTKAILKLQAPHRLALTGTPVENRLQDLWSLFQFLNPGYLGSQAQFRKAFELPIQKDQNPLKITQLKQLVQPFILRRVKTDPAIIQDLPDKMENRQYCQLTREQASLYQAVVDEVERDIANIDTKQRQGLILSTLLRLKQICNHPAQFLQDNSTFSETRSHKLSRLLEMLEEIIDAGESVLIFTQFTEIGGALEKLLRHRCRTFYLHGGTSRGQRETMIDDFQRPDSPATAFVLSLKAGGTGITLTQANHVFHFDRWWNPAVEDQATDRAYRIGQRRQVFVHKFVTLGTLEERIDRMIQDKKALASSVVGSDESWLSNLDNDHFKQLIRLSHDAILE